MQIATCTLEINSLIAFLEGDEAADHAPVAEHLEARCPACVRRLLDLRLALEHGWPAFGVSLN